MGSITMLSQLRIEATRRVGRMWRKSGPTTVGPLTSTTLPSSSEIGQLKSSRKWAVTDATSQVTPTPAVTSIVTTLP